MQMDRRLQAWVSNENSDICFFDLGDLDWIWSVHTFINSHFTGKV